MTREGWHGDGLPYDYRVAVEKNVGEGFFPAEPLAHIGKQEWQTGIAMEWCRQAASKGVPARLVIEYRPNA